MKIGTRRRICEYIAATGFFTVLSGVGGLDLGTIGLAHGIAMMTIGAAVFALAAYKGNFYGGVGR